METDAARRADAETAGNVPLLLPLLPPDYLFRRAEALFIFQYRKGGGGCKGPEKML
jgi:hypothetical protein